MFNTPESFNAQNVPAKKEPLLSSCLSSKFNNPNVMNPTGKTQAVEHTLRKTSILLVYIEPTPYIVDLVKTLMQDQSKAIQIIFLYENLSQNWQLLLPESWIILPTRFKERLGFIHQLFKQMNYDLVHLAGWGNGWILLILLWAKRRRIPVVIESDTPLTYPAKTWKSMLKRLIYPRLFKSVNLFMPGGIRQAKYIEYYGVETKRILSVNMTVDVADLMQHQTLLTTRDKQLFRRRYGIAANHTLVLFVGRLEARKGIRELITAFNQIHVKEVSLLIIGNGSLRAEVELITQQNTAIHYTGRLDKDELIKAYHATDMVVLPAHYEPWGLVINEAMAFGCPVVVSETTGCSEDLVVHLETGLIVKPHCITQLSLALEYLAHFPDKRQWMGEQARSKIAHWTLENEANNIRQGWKKLLCA